MRHKFIVTLFLGIFILLTGCGNQEIVAPETGDMSGQKIVAQPGEMQYFDQTSEAFTFPEIGGALRVMTRNIYLGFDVDVVLGAPNPADIPVLVAEAYQMLLSTDFPARAKAIAREIYKTRPHLIGLQEVATIRIQSPGDAILGGTVPAEEVLYNYLDILMSALENYGLHYKVAGIIQNADVELPMLVSSNPPAFDDVRLTDHDVVLAREDVDISNVMAENYQARLIVPEVGIQIPRGFVAVDARTGGKKYRFVSTHLEPAPNDLILQIQLAQAGELAASLADEKLPIVMLGDFNSPAPTGATYQFFESQGFIDTWTHNLLKYNPNGYTCCFTPDLRNPEITLSERIDIVYVRKKSLFGGGQFIGPVISVVVGDELRDRTPSGLWPSDHAGVAARLQIPQFPVWTLR